LDRPDLSLCMIVRDEQAMLPDFLASVAGIWDEFIAVDTGSRDQSRALLEQAGARVIPFTWRDDFAAARNTSLEEAAGRWILFLDADERVDPELGRAIRDLLDDAEAGAATIVMRNELPGGHRRDSRLLRLFRNDPSIRFRYRIHEDVSIPVQEYLQREGLRLRHLPGIVRHLGYVRATAASRDKKGRDLKLLRLSLEQDPDDFYCRFKILEIARFWDDRELWAAEAATCATLLDKLDGKQEADLKRRNWSGELAVLVSRGLFSDGAQALAWLEQTASWAEPSAAWLLRRGTLLEEAGRPAEARQCYRECLEIPDEASAQLITARPLLGLFRLALAEGDAEAAADLAQRAAALAPRDPEALLALFTSSRLDRSANLLAGHLREHPEAALPVARLHLAGGRVAEGAEILRLLAAEDGEAALGLLVCSLVLGEEFDLEVDVSRERADELLRDWVGILWQCRNAEILGAFAENCGSITGLFPWLPDFLAEETRRLGAG